jgi:hypothetical protein
LYDFCFLPAQFCFIIVHIWKVESHVQIADRCAPWKISNGAENLVLCALQFYASGHTQQKTLLSTILLLHDVTIGMDPQGTPLPTIPLLLRVSTAVVT